MSNSRRLGEVDLSLKLPKPQLYVCKPDKTTISSLKDVYDVVYNIRLGEVDEINFTIPVKVERGHQLVENPLIKLIRHRYLFKLIYNQQTHYFIFNERDKEYGDSESVSYRGYGLGYQLGDKDIREYEAKSKSLSEMLTDVLYESKWKVGYVDADFDTKMRSHRVDSSTVLQAVYDLAEKFNAVIVWDTIKLEINMYNPSNIGMNRGLLVNPEKYLKTLGLSENSDETVTRLKLYGQDGLSIRRLTPTGSNFIEDFSYFMHPFERDEQGNVISQSHYMSNSLAIAIEDYNSFLAGIQGTFDALLDDLKEVQDEIQTESHNLTVLLADLSRIIDERDVYNSTGDGNISDIQRRFDEKEGQIDSKESAITDLVSNEDTIQEDIDELKEQSQMESHLTREQILELNDYIVVKEYTNDIIVDDEDLLKEGVEKFKELRAPSIDLSMDIFNFLTSVESQNDHSKLQIGDTITVHVKQTNIEIQAKIVELEFDFDNDTVSLQISNEKRVSDGESEFEDMMYDANNTSNIVGMNSFKWDLADEANTMVNQILAQSWDANKQSIQAGYNQSITIGERGIVIKSPENPMNMLVIQNGMLAISNDGGNTWKHAIRHDGIVGDRIIGKLLIGARLLIEDEDGIIKIDGSTQTIYDNDGNEKVILGKYDGNQYGIKINSGSIEIDGGLTGDNISQEYTDSIQYDDTDIRKDLRLESPLPNNITLNSSGITASTSSTNDFARLDYRGLYVQGGAVDIRTGASTNRGVIINSSGISGYSSSGSREFHLDLNGNLTANRGTFGGNLSAAGGTFSGNLSAAGGTFTGTLRGVDGTFTGTLSGNTITGAKITGSEIEGGTLISTGQGGTSTIQQGRFENYYSSGEGILRTVIENGNVVSSVSNHNTFQRSVLKYHNLSFQIDGEETLFHPGGISTLDEAGRPSDFRINAKTILQGAVDFSGATVTGLNIDSTAVFG